MPNHDPARLFRHARREAVVSLGLFLVALLWTLGYCYLRGYEHPADSWLVQNGWAVARSADNMQTILGFPDWVFAGIIVPWLLCSIVTFCFCLWGMPDDDLGAEAEEAAGHGH